MSSDRNNEVTYIMIKPDGVQRQLVGKIIQRFEDKGYKLIAMKMMRPSREQFERHYADLAGRGFFAGLVTYMVRAVFAAFPSCCAPSAARTQCISQCSCCSPRAFPCCPRGSRAVVRPRCGYGLAGR